MALFIWYPSGNTPLRSVAFAFLTKCSAERTLAQKNFNKSIFLMRRSQFSPVGAPDKKAPEMALFYLVPPAGIEPTTAP